MAHEVHAPAFDDWLLDRLAECGMPDRFYGWVDALDPDTRGLPRDAGEDYTLTGEDMAAGWAAAGLRATGSGKMRTGSLVSGPWRLSSSLVSSRRSNQLEVTVNARLRRDGVVLRTGTAIHALAADLCERSGRALPDPAYPRPSALGPGDVHWYAARVAELLGDLLAACEATPPPADPGAEPG